MATPKAQQRRDRDAASTPLSPSVTSRKDEKDQMINLNNRMAVYVEKVRSLETENSRLQIQVSSYEQTSSREVSNMKAMYEGELGEARRLLDEVSKEKAQLQMEASSFKEKYECEKNRANDLAHDNGVLEGKLKDLNILLNAKDAQYSRIKKERDEFCEELESLRAKYADVQQELETAQQMLESETIKRVDFENKLQSLREELLFKERLHREEISEVRKRHTVSLTEVDQKVKVDYESRLEAAIIDLREQQTADLEQLKEDLEAQYRFKITELGKQIDIECKSRLKAQELSKASDMKTDRLQSTIRGLQTQNNNLNNRVQDLEGQVETEREIRISAVLVVEKQRDEVRDTLARMEKDYSELLDIKLQLDHEIAVYRKLLEEEEERLNLSPSQTEEGKGRTRSRRKRKRVVTQSAEGEARAKKKEMTSSMTTTTYTIETDSRVEKTQRRAEADPSPEGTNSCLVM